MKFFLEQLLTLNPFIKHNYCCTVDHDPSTPYPSIFFIPPLLPRSPLPTPS